MESVKVLIVDDEADLVQAFKWRFEAEGFQALTAGSAVEALGILEFGGVDVILADFLMPGVDGIEMVRRIRNTPRLVGVKVLVFSCHEDPATRRRALRCGALDYLSKSMGASRIVSRVSEVLATSPTARAEPVPRVFVQSDAERDVASALQALYQTSTAFPRSKRSKATGRETRITTLAEDLGRLAVALAERCGRFGPPDPGAL